ncbi:MAG: porphobilinogen synthase [Candidatus Omnitrophica bacterium]|jgi:porphobilinogen synthase|nr:porphobilinogen synthase [Candidatus Omnitrophota bacterium]
MKVEFRKIIKVDELIYPLFIKEDEHLSAKINSLTGVYRISLDSLLKEVNQLKSLGLNKFLIFGVPKRKTKNAESAYKDENIVSKAIKILKVKYPKITLMADVCLCAYTLNGHCRILKKNHIFDEEKTLDTLAKIALTYAKAGADYIAPSAVARGEVKVIRKVLDKSDYRQVKIMGYSAKFASNFYGPFRNIANSTPKFGERSYQLDFNDKKQIFSKVAEDIKHGVDIIMVKPALGYLDIVREIKDKFNFSLATYNVSGEYFMAKKGAQLGIWDEKKIVFEIISSIKRAGSDFIITYHAKDVAKWLSYG